jgi:hypothetical protein
MALVIAAILALHTALAPVIPIADGESYAIRAFVLYGYLHTGQWDNFWKLLSSPNQSILPLHYLLFFSFPQAFAGVTSYVFAQNITTYLLLAYAVFKMAQVLNRSEWAPAIFLLCSINNVALTDFYAFFLDGEFFALGLLVIALQMEAWKEKQASICILSGIGLGLLFEMKPANALIFLAIYILSEICRGGYVFLSCKAKMDRRPCMLNLFRHWGYQSLGFIPLLCLVFISGGAQTILQIIDHNEIHDSSTPLACENLLRLLYFPLCLSACYHVILLGGLLIGAFFASKWMPMGNNQEDSSLIPFHLFIPVAVSYLILGEFFSFWMLVKPMRSLLLILPLFWFAFCWLWEKRRLRVELFLPVAVIYTFLAFSQKAFNFLETKGPVVEDNYQLSMSSWTEMPSAWRRGPGLDQIIYNWMSPDLPSSGIICVNSIELRNSLAWRLGIQDFLLGKEPRYEVRNIFDYQGAYYDKSLIGSNVVILITFFPIQSSRLMWLETMDFLDYGNGEWCARNGLAQINEMPSVQEQPIGYEFVFQQPLTEAQVDAANKSAPFAKTAKADSKSAGSFYGFHYSRAEGWELLKVWFNKRFSKTFFY